MPIVEPLALVAAALLSVGVLIGWPFLRDELARYPEMRRLGVTAAPRDTRYDMPEPSIAYGQWTSLTLGYSQCIARAPGALHSADYVSWSHTFRGWFGSAGPTSATIICYALGKGSLVTINVASNEGLDTANASLRQLAVALFGKPLQDL